VLSLPRTCADPNAAQGNKRNSALQNPFQTLSLVSLGTSATVSSLLERSESCKFKEFAAAVGEREHTYKCFHTAYPAGGSD
jgi:hypothetical protein